MLRYRNRLSIEEHWDEGRRYEALRRQTRALSELPWQPVRLVHNSDVGMGVHDSLQQRGPRPRRSDDEHIGVRHSDRTCLPGETRRSSLHRTMGSPPVLIEHWAV